MDSLQQIGNGAKEIGTDLGMTFVVSNVKAEKVESGYVENDIVERATRVGPVLEEILQCRWEHWGLNE